MRFLSAILYCYFPALLIIQSHTDNWPFVTYPSLIWIVTSKMYSPWIYSKSCWFSTEQLSLQISSTQIDGFAVCSMLLPVKLISFSTMFATCKKQIPHLSHTHCRFQNISCDSTRAYQQKGNLLKELCHLCYIWDNSTVCWYFTTTVNYSVLFSVYYLIVLQVL